MSVLNKMMLRKKYNRIRPLQAQRQPIFEKKKQTYRFAPQPGVMKGSATIEAAISLTALILVVIFLYQFFWMISVTQKMEYAMMETALDTGRKECLFQMAKQLVSKGETHKGRAMELAGKVINQSYLYAQVRKRSGMDDKTNFGQTRMKNFHCMGSAVDKEKNELNLECGFTLQMQYLPDKISKFYVKRRITSNMWLGKSLKDVNEDSTEDGEREVYVTESGTVYHDSISCTHLSLSIENVSFNQVKNRRNTDGAKYYACPICMSGGMGKESVYITEDGTNYHSTLSCSGIKRTIKKVKLKDIGTRKECERCRERRG